MIEYGPRLVKSRTLMKLGFDVGGSGRVAIFWRLQIPLVHSLPRREMNPACTQDSHFWIAGLMGKGFKFTWAGHGETFLAPCTPTLTLMTLFTLEAGVTLVSPNVISKFFFLSFAY